MKSRIEKATAIFTTVCLTIFVVNLSVVFLNIGKDGIQYKSTLLGYAYSQTPTAKLYEKIYQIREFENDPTFNIREHESLILKLPDSHLHKFRPVKSEEEFQYVVTRIERDIRAEKHLSASADYERMMVKAMTFGADPIFILGTLSVFFVLIRITQLHLSPKKHI
ncbi:MAG: hypothetical protein DI626_11085 [Micavibrio aeruginosavorus]|uniref:Uncharacterized protein n=1 Tax=Micavibrio aeruginosavorus TaxID=349221 RepID=A0A2W4ZF02_9BACT|nr:MAG: hypothetical protein DI626_11085 [Micavibrio aeruginosavorus]